MDIDKKEFKNILLESNSYTDISKKIFGYSNNRTHEKVKNYINYYDLSIDHFGRKKKYKIIEKECPVCGELFKTKKGHEREKTTCSHSCSNTYFRSGEKNGNWKNSTYRSTCFEYHEKECIICGEDKIVEVHHYDENKENNNPENLIPLCPTHHKYWHSRHKGLIFKKVKNYRKEFLESMQ